MGEMGDVTREGQLEELSGWELEAGVVDGLFVKVEDHKEHFAIAPYWLTQPRQGILQELTKTLGKWNSKLEAYPVGFEKMRASSNVAALNEDHRWFHLDIFLTYFLYKPEEGQQLKGIIQKIGQKAAICTTFNVFTATVYPQNEYEQTEWVVGQEVVFTVTFVQNRRKGPFIRGDSTGTAGSTTSFTVSKQTSNSKNKSKKFTDEEENWDVVDITEDKVSVKNELSETKEEEDWEQSPKKKKKKDKRRKKSEEIVVDLDQVDLDSTIHNADDDDDIQEIPPPKKKKKKRKD